MAIAFKRGVLQCCTINITPVVKDFVSDNIFFVTPFISKMHQIMLTTTITSVPHSHSTLTPPPLSTPLCNPTRWPIERYITDRSNQPGISVGSQRRCTSHLSVDRVCGFSAGLTTIVNPSASVQGSVHISPTSWPPACEEIPAYSLICRLLS